MHPRLRRVSMAGPALATLILLVSCSGHPGSTTTSAEITTTGPHPATTTAATTSSATLARDESVTVHLAPFSAMLPGWTEQVFLYGEGEEFLGNSPGGEGLMLGPEYGTQTPDGTWWFLDAANLRIAHFAEDGTYLSQVVMPEDLLVDGQFFQYQMPQALDDGSIAAGSFRGEETMALLRIVDGGVSGVTFDGAIPWVTTDGAYLYGLSIVDGLPNRLDPNNPAAEEVDWFGARDGSRYLVTVNEDEVLVELPDATTPLTRTLQMRFSEDPEVIARAGIEVETGADGTIFMLFYGAPMSDETLDIGGLVTIGPDGVVSETEQITSPFSMSDPGSPAHLGVRPGTSTPWMMVVGEDGVHVFTMTG